MKPLMVAAAAEATDDQLVAAAQQGSDAAFEALFRRYCDRITGYVRSIVSDHARAEDIVQDVFVSALRSLRSTDRVVVFKPWVYEIAKNACIDHIRRSRRASEVSIDSEDFSLVDEGRLSAGVAATDAEFSAREDFDSLKMAFNDLPDAQREVLVSREFEGLSYDTISRRTGLSRSAVESMLFRARRSLKDGFDDISTGDRCQRMQATMGELSGGDIGVRIGRRLTKHLRDCATCRREAVALGLDELAVGAPSRTSAALSRVAAFLPLPGFLRRRWLDGAGLLGSGGGAADQGASLAGKAAVVLAAAAIAGGGAGVAHKAGVIGSGAAGTGASPATGQPAASSAGGGSSKGSAGVHRVGARAKRPSGTSGSRGVEGPGKSGSHTGTGDARGPGGGSAANGGGGNESATSGAAGTVGGATRGAGGTVGGTVNGVGGTVNGVGGTVNGVTGTLGGTVQGVGGTLGGAVQGAGGAITAPSGGQTGSQLPVVPQLKRALPAVPQAPVTAPDVQLPSP